LSRDAARYRLNGLAGLAGKNGPFYLTAPPRSRPMEQMREDAAAVALARDGDAEAFRSLVERHSRLVFRVAYRMTGNESDAEDVVQETFLKAYRQLGRFESRANFGTWVYRIAVNCAIDYMRSRPKRESTEEDDVLERVAGGGNEPGAEELVLAGEIGQRVQS